MSDMDELSQLDRDIARSREKSGDMFYLGSPDPALVRARTIVVTQASTIAAQAAEIAELRGKLERAREEPSVDTSPVDAYLAAKPGTRLWSYWIAEHLRTMEEALKPFADVADEYDDSDDDHHEVWVDAGPQRVIRGSFKLEHYRRARSARTALSSITQPKEPSDG